MLAEVQCHQDKSLLLFFLLSFFFLISIKLNQLDQSDGLLVMLGPELYSSIILRLSQFLLVQKNYSIK